MPHETRAFDIPTYRHRTLTPEGFADRLDQLGIGFIAFSRMTGVRRRTLVEWMEPGGKGPPYWVRSYLGLISRPDVMAAAHALADQFLMTEDEYAKHKESS